MRKPAHVSIIDYGASNMANVQHAFEHIGVTVNIVTTAEQILNAERLVFPGVGSFPDAMAQLHRDGLACAIKEAALNKPFLGVCLGMQMLLSSSVEFELTPGLDLIKGQVIKLPQVNSAGQALIIPNTGWARIELQRKSKLLTNVPADNAFYFVHSYHAQVNDPSHQLATSQFDQYPISAIIGKDNILGCQFHPEKSGQLGLKIIQNFLTI
ncbi:MAG: imidazole glycerol phosphate synthase subunit HisH [Gammaproteobacteria bacterium]|nr:imidazole glycerol phosphate synthase subunit HisH [Gammaproteobacteria bacterium]